MSNVQVTLSLPPEVDRALRALAKSKSLTMSDVLRRGIGLMQSVEMDTQAGRYVGATSKREDLESVYVTPI